MDLVNKVCLITGGTRGIGAATALHLAREGADVAITGRHDDEDAAATRRSIESLGRCCEIIVADHARPADSTRCVEEAVQRLGGVDVLIHSAGGPAPGRLEDVTPEAWYEAFEVHVHAVFHLSRAALPHMRAKKQGAIVLISSVAGIRGVPNILPYQAVKGALPQLTRALARDLAADNIRVNCVSPGIIRTRFHARMTEEQKRLNLDQRIPLGREGTPEQVAEVIALLVKNDYVTGENYVVDGGLTMRIA